MSKRSTIIKNWPKYLLQWGVLASLILFLTGVISSENAADPETYCPMGGLQALATYLANNSLPCSMSMVQIAMGLALVAAVVLFSKLFCAYICPVGTVQDLQAHSSTLSARRHFPVAASMVKSTASSLVSPSAQR